MNMQKTWIAVLLFSIACINIRFANANSFLYLADSLYLNEHYEEALNHYQKLVATDRYFKQDFDLNFKIGYCYLKGGNLSKAEQIFGRLKKNQSLIAEYLDYFLFYIAYRQNNARKIYARSDQFFRKYSHHFLTDSVSFHLADFDYNRRRFKSAYRRYIRLLKKKQFKKHIPLFVTENMVGYKFGEFVSTRTFRKHGGVKAKKAATKT